jgi:hypothetical protein
MRALAAIALVLAVVLTSNLATAQQTLRLVGMITEVEGSTLTVKARDGTEARVHLTPDAAVFGLMKATLADIRPGAFIGVGAIPQPDGTQRAIQVTIFAESLRGAGEGHRPWTRPGSTMTNATVETIAVDVHGPVLTVRYREGDKIDEKRIFVPAEAVVRAYVVGTRDELKPGAYILIVGAVRKPDGTLEASRVNVGRDGIVPQ